MRVAGPITARLHDPGCLVSQASSVAWSFSSFANRYVRVRSVAGRLRISNGARYNFPGIVDARIKPIHKKQTLFIYYHPILNLFIYFFPHLRLRDGEPLEVDGTHVKQLVLDDGTVILQLDVATEADGGVYTCVATNADGENTTSAPFTVLGE